MTLSIHSIKKLNRIIHSNKTNKLIRHPFFIDTNHIIIEIDSEYLTSHKSNINPTNIDNIIDFYCISYLDNLI